MIVFIRRGRALLYRWLQPRSGCAPPPANICFQAPLALPCDEDAARPAAAGVSLFSCGARKQVDCGGHAFAWQAPQVDAGAAPTPDACSNMRLVDPDGFCRRLRQEELFAGRHYRPLGEFFGGHHPQAGATARLAVEWMGCAR